MKRLTIVLFALLSVLDTRTALAQVDQFYTTQQVYYALTLSDAIAAPHLHRGMKVLVATNGVNSLVPYTVVDAGTKTVSSPTVVNCTVSSCQLVADVTLVSLGSVSLASLPTGTTNYVITNKGSGNVWAPVDDAIHGNRGGGALHANSTTSVSGFMPAQGNVAGFAHTDGFGAFSWSNSIPFSYLTGLPTLTTTLPLTGGGTLGALTLGVNTVSPTSAGVVPAFSATGGPYILLTNGSAPFWGAPALNTGAGTQYHLPRYTATGTVLGDSGLTDNGAQFTTNEPLEIVGTGSATSVLQLTNGNLGMRNTGSTRGAWAWQAAAPTSTTGALVLYGGAGTAIEYLSDTGLHGFGGVINPTANVDTPTLRIRTGAANGYLLTSGSDGTGGWNSISGLGLLQNGAARYYTSDFLTLGSAGDYDTGGGTLGYETQATSTAGKDLNLRAQSSSASNGGSVNIYAGTGSTSSPDNSGQINLVAGPYNAGTVNVTAGRLATPSGVIYRLPTILDSVRPFEDVQWTALKTTGNSFVTIWFYGMDGAMTIDSGVYTLIWTVMARSTYFTATVIHTATWTVGGGVVYNDSAPIANAQGLTVTTGTSGGWIYLTVATLPGIGSGVVTRWDAKTQIIKH